MNRFGILLFSFFSLLLAGCDGNYREVVISGQVKDSLTGESIAGSEINVTCWVYDTKIWESRKVVKDTLSDINGNFSILFEKGEAIDVEVKHENYKTLKLSKTLERSDNTLEFKFKKANLNKFGLMCRWMITIHSASLSTLALGRTARNKTTCTMERKSRMN